MDWATYSPAVRQLLREERLYALGPGEPNLPLRSELERMTAATLFAPDPVRGIDFAQACLAGVWLYHDFLESSHSISQEIETVEGSYWHALMHRREPDAANSKYWFRRVGAHPVLQQLAEQTPNLGYTYTNPFDFVDFCERVRGSGSADEESAKRVQLLEWRFLFDHCYRQAVEG